MSRSKGWRRRWRGGSGEVLASLKAQAVTVLIAESNEVHVADLLACAYHIERGAVTLGL